MTRKRERQVLYIVRQWPFSLHRLDRDKDVDTGQSNELLSPCHMLDTHPAQPTLPSILLPLRLPLPQTMMISRRTVFREWSVSSLMCLCRAFLDQCQGDMINTKGNNVVNVSIPHEDRTRTLVSVVDIGRSPLIPDAPYLMDGAGVDIQTALEVASLSCTQP